MTDNNQSTQESEQKVMDANRSARENEPKAIDNNQAAQESEPRLADTNQSVEDGTQEVDDTDQAAGEDANEEIDFDDLAEADANQVANTPSAFPSFKDGDVLIVLAADIIFQLHSEVLRRSSKVLASLLIEENAVKLLPKAKRKGTTTRWRLDLKRHNFNMKRPGVFELEGLDRHGRPNTPMTIRANCNGLLPDPTYATYGNVFRAFYNEPLQFNPGMKETVLDCNLILEAAIYMDAVKATRGPVEAAMLQYGKRLFRSIAAHPETYARFARFLQSRVLFKECLIHIVGLWEVLTDEARLKIHQIGPKMVRLCEKKVETLKKQKEAIETRICGFYPLAVIKDPQNNTGRQSYSSDIYAWQALALFRHWWSEKMCQGYGRNASDGGFELYSVLYEAGEAYCDQQWRDHFHTHYCPMTAKSMAIVNKCLNEYKQDVKGFVAPLMTNNTQVELEPNEQFNRLVCLHVGENDYPWLMKDE